MAVFTVHVPPGSADTLARAERTVFLRDGFSWAGFLFGPLALLYRRLWIAALAWVVVAAAILAGGHALRFPDASIFGLLFLLALVTGFEAAALREVDLRRRGFSLAALLVSPSRDAAEQVFFRGGEGRAASPRPAARPPMPAMSDDVIGLFPEPGAGA